MSAYNIGISGTVPDVCWVRPAHAGEWEIFCNSPAGYDLFAIAQDGAERVVDSAEGPTSKTVALDLREDEANLSIRVR